MALYAYPSRLHTLALGAVSEYVSDLLVLLVTFPQHAERQNFKTYCVQPICKRLEKAIESTVPPSLAADMTINLLKYMDDIYYDLLHGKFKEGYRNVALLMRGKKKWNAKTCCKLTFSSSKQRHADYRSWCQQIAEEVLCAIFHSLETRLDTTSLESCNLPIICDGIFSKLRNLKVIRLGYELVNEESLLNGVRELEALEEFSYSSSWDILMEVLSGSCKGLKVLDIHDSVRVTDASVQFIVTFLHLEELNISDTCISRGIKGILIGFAGPDVPGGNKYRTLLTKLSACFEIYDPTHIRLLSENFIHLTYLSLSLSIDCSLIPLKTLKSLTSLALCERPFFIDITVSDAEEMLQEIGAQLTSLHLEGISGINLMFVYENCPYLRFLDLHFVHCSSLGFPDDLGLADCEERYPLPYLESVQSLDVFLVNCFVAEYIVSRCVNAKTIHIRWRVKKSCVRNLLHSMASGHLEEFSIAEGTNVTLSDELVIISKFDKSTRKHITYNTDVKNIESILSLI
ncbi:uncharacterized protein [Periplaneta americana]|uniref:uncharacterized protein n=1 Tax=Periplaneta americana TaxID=6978 RepID=UPI0037E7D99F